MSLTKSAQEAVAQFPDSDIECAIFFLQNSCKAFCGESNDRLVKVGRSLKGMVDLFEDTDNDADRMEESLQRLVQECELLLTGNQLKVPRVRFGKTELQMPIVTLGCMRFQQEWGPRITNMNMVGSDCQDNLLSIVKRAVLDHGMVHIETARGYGSSELQLGVALKRLFVTGQVKREDLILQTKIKPYPKVQDFRDAVELSLQNLQVDYVDLFAFHGFNYEEQWEWIFGSNDTPKEETCLGVVQELVAAGKIRHIGFSTHGSTDLICRAIQQDVFDYVNLHYHYVGSYTATGGGPDGKGNLNAVKLLKERDMGVFIISPFDKGGRLYAPSKKLRSLTLPDMEPIDFMSHWIWNHHLLGEESLPQLHTYTLGAARPSDLDQAVVAAHLHATKPKEMLEKTKRTVERLEQAKIDALGKEWVDTWWKGLPKNTQCKSRVEHNQIVWMYNSIQAFGLHEFAKNRYSSLEGNWAKWDPKLPDDKNIENVGKDGWGFVPGLPLDPNMDYSEELRDVPEENKERVIEAQAFVYKWCRKQQEEKKDAKGNPMEQFRTQMDRMRRNFNTSRQSFRMPQFNPKDFKPQEMFKSFGKKPDGDEQKETEEEGVEEPEVAPTEWETSYDMRPWPDYPDQPSRA